MPGLDIELPAASDADLAAPFGRWRDYARVRSRLQNLTASFRSRRPSDAASDSPSASLVKVSTWAERDAALRAAAIPITPFSSAPPEEPSIGLPFVAAADLPAAFVNHKDHSAIRNIIDSRLDRTLSRWRRRALYSAENWNEWSEWTQPSATHRDRLEAGRVFLEPSSILTAPRLRDADVETAADAWNVYRRHLLILIRQALTVGFPWVETLARLSSTFSDPTLGYPRLANHVTAALEDDVLLAYPPLHADVIIYKLDCSYASGSDKYSSESSTVDWDSAVSRQPGEDPVSLAIRVTTAFLTKHDDATLNNVSVWTKPSFVNEINNRYAKCLRCDLADPTRGADSFAEFRTHWYSMQAHHQVDPVKIPASQLSCEYLAHLYIVPSESARYVCDVSGPEPAPAQPALQLTHHTHQTGAGARARRDARRAHLFSHHEEPPPSAYRPDTLLTHH